jgi:uncharacterized protein (DUF2141 family)
MSFKILHKLRALLATAAVGLNPLQAFAADLILEISNVTSTQGTILIRVFDKADDYLKRPTQRLGARPQLGITTISITGLNAGDHAFALHHDVNDNGKMDTSLIGMPSEPYAFSSDAKPGMSGPPSFDQAKFNVPAIGGKHSVKLR